MPTSSVGATERTLLRAIMRFKVDPKGIRDINRATSDIDEQFEQLMQHIDEMERPLADLGDFISGFESIAIDLTTRVDSITTRMVSFAEQYVDAVKGAETISQEWVETTQKLQAAQVAYGATAAQSVLPMMKLQAEIIQTASDFLNKYPELSQIVFGIGTAVLLASSLSTAVLKGIKVIADVKLFALEAQRFISAKLMERAANKQLLAAGQMKLAADQQLVSDLRGKFAERGTLLGRAKGAIGGAAGKVGGAIGGLGLTGVLSVAAIAASLVAIGISVKRFSDNLSRGTKQVEGSWVAFLDKTKKTSGSAVQSLDEYRQAQERVSDAHDKAGPIADIFVNKQKAMTAGAERINEVLLSTAESYEDYQTAVEKFNETLVDGEDEIRLISRETFNYQRKLEDLRAELVRGEASLEEYGRALVEGGNIVDQIVGATLYSLGRLEKEQALTKILDDWIEYQQDIQDAQDRLNQETIDAWSDFKDDYLALQKETADKALEINRQYSTDLLKLELDTETKREDILTQAGIDLVDTEHNIAQDRQDAMTSYFEDAKAAEEEYYQSRTDAAADFGIEVQRAEEDHQRALRKLREESELRQMDAINARDALALINERRSYERDRRESEEQFSIDMQRRNEDYARQAAQQERSFRQQQEAREKAYQEQLKAIEERLRKEKEEIQKGAKEQLKELENSRVNELRSLHDHKGNELDELDDSNTKQEKKLTYSLNKRLTDSRTAYRDELTDLRNNFTKKRQEAGLWNDREYTQYNRFRENNLSTLRDFVTKSNLVLRGLRTPPAAPGGGNRQGGGYAGYGVYHMGERGEEFVMSNKTTKAAEQLVGARLNQDNVLAALSGINGAGANITQQFTFNGRLSEDEKEEYKRIAYEQSLMAQLDVAKGMR